MATTTSTPSPQAAAFNKPQLPPDAKPAQALELLMAGKWTPEDFQKWDDSRSKPSKSPANSLSCKVSEKGALSVYGLGRWPITLYSPQWARLAEFMPQVLEFAEANKSRLSTEKPAKTEQAKPAPIVQPSGPTLPPMTPEIMAQLAALLASQSAA